MSPFPRPDYDALRRYDPERSPVRLDLSDNTNLWGTHPGALARIRDAATDDLARYPELYADELRSAVSDRFGVPMECVTTGAGSDDILDSTFRAAWTPGSIVRYAAPTFSMVEPFARMNGLEPSAVPWPEAEDDPARLLDGDPALVYVCRPNNPTGSTTSLEWFEELVSARGERRTLLVVDEAYADFAEDTLLPEAPRHPNLIVTRTTSKAYGLAGLRCGFAVADAEATLAVEKSRGPYKVSALAAAAAAVAVRDEEEWLPDIVAMCIDRRSALFAELERRGLRPVESRANFILCAAPTGDARRDALSLREAGVGVRPFTDVPNLGDGLRVTVGPEALMGDFLSALDSTFELSGGGA
jgi:histidinol-phosphate aminotransferase